MIPVKQISTYILSLGLTALSFWIILGSGYSFSIAFPAILLFAIAQALIQIFFFMHLNESQSKSAKYLVIFLGLAIAAIIAVGSVWVMRLPGNM